MGRSVRLVRGEGWRRAPGPAPPKAGRWGEAAVSEAATGALNGPPARLEGLVMDERVQLCPTVLTPTDWRHDEASGELRPNVQEPS
jgi:hypothetical protein